MAVQMHVAHSSVINGAAIFAGGPYYCAESNLLYAEEKCMDVTLGGPEVSKLATITWEYSAFNYIDSPSHLSDDNIYLFSGADDSVVDPTVVQALQSYYSVFTDVDNIVADYNVESEHCIPTVSFGEVCNRLSSPYIGNCQFDGAGAGLQTIYNNKLTAPESTSDYNTSNLFSFDQTPYISSKQSSIGDQGYIYIPTSCQSGNVACSLHVSFHGCKQNLETIGNLYASSTGFNSWAEINNIIVLYPYAKVSNSLPSNPNGCWDWWAYTGTDYGFKTGKQIKFVRSLITKIAGI
eukprot:gene18765-24532_t